MPPTSTSTRPAAADADAEPARKLVGLHEAADKIGVSTKTIRRWIAAGLVTGYRAGPRLIRVDLVELDEVLCPIPTAGGHDAGLASLTDAAQRDRLAAHLRGGSDG